MKVLLINAYFYPENTAFGHMEKEILDTLIARGHEVDVVCPVPCRGISDEIIESYKHIKEEVHRDIRIHRYWAPRESSHPVSRAFRYFWGNIRGNMIGRRFRNTDVFFTISTPPTQGLFVGKLAKKFKAPMIYSLQDVFPDSLVTTGLSHEGSLLYRIGSVVEKKTYKLCSKIIVLSETVENNLIEKGVPSEKLLTINNWIDSDNVRPVPREENPLFDEFNVDRNKFIVLYAGNLGASQDSQVIINAAERLRDNEDIQFCIFGSGPEYDFLYGAIDTRKLKNVLLNPLLPTSRVSEVYSMGDVDLITCKKGVSQAAMPSKLWTIMACDTPIIAAFDLDSELNETLKEANGGICVEPENYELLADEIEKAYLRKKSGLRPEHWGGREYVSANNSNRSGVSKYVECIESFGKKKR